MLLGTLSMPDFKALKPGDLRPGDLGPGDFGLSMLGLF
jgi:hypothetical protein